MNADEHLKVIVGDMMAHFIAQIAIISAERDVALAERDRLVKQLAEAVARQALEVR